MELKQFYKVIIVGAGPSGLSTALNLLKCGVSDLLVIEKHRFPRYKCCAGYITDKTKEEYKKIGLDVSDCNYSLIKDFNIYYKNKSRLKIDNKFLYTNRRIDRVELDNGFYGLAVSKGITVAENTVIKEHDAVGACDPLTLSGLRYGLRTGEYCAAAIARGKLKIYKRHVRGLRRRFALMRLMQKVFYLKITLFLTFNVLCRCFGSLVCRVFNNFFINKK